jgi:hypothetical protein
MLAQNLMGTEAARGGLELLLGTAYRVQEVFVAFLLTSLASIALLGIRFRHEFILETSHEVRRHRPGEHITQFRSARSWRY